MSNAKEMFRFETEHFAVIAECYPDCDVDTSFDETGDTAANLESGLWCAFCTSVKVIHKTTGATLGSSSLGGSIYENPSEFFESHRDPEPMYRNCSIMRSLCGDKTVICHYFPDMVREAVAEARESLHAMRAARVRAA